MTPEELNVITNAEKIAALSVSLLEANEEDEVDTDCLRDLIFDLHQTIYPNRWTVREAA